MRNFGSILGYIAQRTRGQVGGLARAIRVPEPREHRHVDKRRGATREGADGEQYRGLARRDWRSPTSHKYGRDSY